MLSDAREMALPVSSKLNLIARLEIVWMGVDSAHFESETVIARFEFEFLSAKIRVSVENMSQSG